MKLSATRPFVIALHRLAALAVMAVFLSLFAAPSATATTFTWNGGYPTTGSWNNTANWAGGVAPGAGSGNDIVFTSVSTNHEDTYLVSAKTVNSITYQAGAKAFQIRLATSGAGGTAANLTFQSGNTGITVQSGVANVEEIGQSDGSIVLSGNLTVTHNGSANLLISQPITGSAKSLTKAGSGLLTLSDANTYSGPTTVSGGTLRLSGSLVSATTITTAGTLECDGSLNSTVTINNGGTLSGTGSISGLVTNNAGGTLAPGLSIGRLTLNSDVVLNTGSTNTFEVDGSAPTNDVIVLGGAITYGGVLNLVTNGGFTAGQTFTLFQGAGATNASNFDSISGSPGSGLGFAFTNGVLTVFRTGAALADTVRVEAAADGSANTNVPAQTLAPGASITNYAIARDGGGGFLTNLPATWSLVNVTGSVVDADLVAAPDGKSAVFTANGPGSAQIMAVANATNFVASGVITVSAPTNKTARPFIWVRNTDRNAILDKIQNNSWAATIYNGIVAREATDLASYLANRDSWLRGLPVLWSSSPAVFKTMPTYSGVDNAAEAKFNNALDCAVLYYLTGDTNYAQCAADLLHNAVTTLAPVAPSTSVGNGGWIIQDNWNVECRVLGTQLPVIYDFLYAYLQTHQVYDVQIAGLTNFNFTAAQTVFRTYYQLCRDHGDGGDNWSSLEATCMLNNLLALDSMTERATDLQVYLTTGTSRQDSLDYDYKRDFKNPGDIWHESFQYSGAVSTIRTFNMVLLERYDATLNLFGVYTNLPTSLPRIAQFCYPNPSMQISFGDGHRDDGTSQPYDIYEMIYQHAQLRGRTNLTSVFGGLINGGVSAGKYNRAAVSDYSRLGTHSEPLQLLWSAPTIAEPGVKLTYPRSDQLSWAGIAVQRNPSTVSNSTYGLMGFVGGAAHVHSHASGMNMELFGLGQVMGAKAGRDAYGSAIHEDYYRLFSAANTVVVNAGSCGSGGWQGIAINTVQTVAMEPAALATAVSSNFSFSCSSFVDDKGTLAEATQQRTLSIIRTSPTNGFYVDFFRSKSTVTNRVATTLNGNVTNQFHDYIYRNIGSTNFSLTTNGVALGLVSQPNRFQNDIGDSYNQPGWRYFTNTAVSYPQGQPTRVQFNATPSGTTLYMDMIVPAVTNREYARVASPPIVDYNSTAPGPTVVVRQIGEAWDKPFAVVYEPHFSASGSTVTNVTALWNGNVVVGLKIESVVNGQSRVYYVLSNPNATDTYTDNSIGLAFKGRFAIATDNGDGTGSLYLGSGSSLQFNGYLMASVSGANTQAQLTFATGQPPVVTANSAVTVTSPGATLSNLVPSAGVLTPAFSGAVFNYSVEVPLAVTSLTVTPTAAVSGATIQVNGNLVASGTVSGPINLNPGANLISTVVVSPDASSTNTYVLTVNRTSNKSWDATGTTAGAGGTPTGTWGVSSFWNSDSTGGASGAFTNATINYDDLFLVAAPSATSGSNAYVVTVSGSQSANSLNFQSAGAPTISGGTAITLGDGGDGDGGITVPQYAYGTTAQGNPTISTPIILNNSQSWFVDAGRTLTVNGVVSGSGMSLTKSGAGILKLDAASTHDGDTLIAGGTVALGQQLPLPNTSGISLAEGTTLRPDVTNVFLGAPIILSDSGGTATINAPTLNLGGGGGIVSPLTLGGPISGDGNVVFNGSASDNTYGTILLNAQSTYSGSTLLNTTSTGATLFLKLGIDNALPATTVLTIDGGNGSGSGRITQLDLNGCDQTLAGLTNIPRTLRLQRVVNRSTTYAVLTVDNAEDFTFSGQLGSANGSTGGVNFGLTKRGPGIFHLAAATAYSGDTTVEGGTLNLTQPTLDSQSAISIAAGTVLQLDFAGTNHVASLLLADTNQPGGIYDSSNAAPFITGTGSLEVTSVPSSPTIDSATLSGTNLVISLSTLLGLNYMLQWATNLSPTINWQSESTNTGTGDPLLLNVPIEPDKPQKFLRIWVY